MSLADPARMRPVLRASSDADLHGQLVGGDDSALAGIFERCGRAVHHAALAVTRDHAAAEDIAQVVMLALWEHPERYRPDLGELRPWLAQVARNRALDWLRAETAARNREIRASQRARLDEPSTAERAETTVIAEQVRGSVAALPRAERVPITLAYFGGLSYRQVAADLAIPEGTVKTHIRVGLRRLASLASLPS